ncbi:MAG TPA: IPT/TIG domain-containing protein [Thermoanaerobaculia bacterium]
MRRFFLLVLVSVSAFAQAPAPVIRSIVPAAGPAEGGTTVTIMGDNLSLPPNFACLLPCPSRVTFGGTRATLVQESNTSLVVTTPPHPAGSVDVVVVTGDQRTVTAFNAFLYDDIMEASYERILLPIYLEVPAPGSNGSVWQTQLFLRNNGANAITLAPWVCPLGALCIPQFPLTRTLQPSETLIDLPRLLQQSNVARLLYVNSAGADDLSAGLRLNETSREADAGTEIPVVRDAALRKTAIHLHNIPRGTNFRAMLRVYELGVDDARFHVRVFEEGSGVDNGALLSEFDLRAVAPETGSFRMHPAYAESALALTVPPDLATTTVRVDVEPLTTGSRYWAFVSITTNDTQRVTLVTPQ